MSSAKWVFDQIRSLPATRLVLFTEKGWSNHQDVVAFSSNAVPERVSDQLQAHREVEDLAVVDQALPAKDRSNDLYGLAEAPYAPLEANPVPALRDLRS